MTGIKRLEIHIGVPPIPGDTNTNEPPVEVLILLGSLAGFALKLADEWQPNRARLKSGGLYIDAATQNGSIPQDFSYENPTEIINLSLDMPTSPEVDEQITRLQRFIDKAQRFSTTYAQTTPVYLLYQDPQAPGEQYSLIYGVDVAVVKDGNHADVTLTLTREPFWYEDPPFSNPKLRSLRLADVNPSATNVSLISESDDLITATVQNRHEYDSTDYPGTPLSQNWLDIDGDLITGDATALVQIAVKPTTNFGRIFIGISSKPDTAFDSTGAVVRNAYNFNLGDADYVSSSGGATLTKPSVIGSGLLSNGSNVTRYYVQAVMTSLGVGGEVNVGVATAGGDPIIPLNRQILRGRYAVFVRSSINSAGSISARLSYFEGASVNPLTSEMVVVGTFAIASTADALAYAGELNLPIGSRSSTGVNGLGLESTENEKSNCCFRIDTFTNSVAGARTARVSDIIMIPIDEGAIYSTYILDSGNLSDFTILDGTGYLLRDNAPITKSVLLDDVSSVTEVLPMPTIGFLELKPKTDYRIYFVWATSFASVELPSNIDDECEVFINLKPRWLGIRSE